MLVSAQAITHLVMDVDSVEEEPSHSRALASVIDGEVLQLRGRGVLV